MPQPTIIDTTLRGEATGRVQDLPGFTRFHRPPEDHSPRARGFVQAAGSQEVAERASRLFTSIRTGLGYKRREMALACDGGGASIVTPGFDVTLTLEQDPKVAQDYRLLTEVSAFRRHNIVNTPQFLAVFSGCCDTVLIRFANPLDLAEKIDRIEEIDELASFLDYDPQCAWLTLRLPHLLVEMTALQITCRLPGEGNLGQLITQTQAALERLSGEGFDGALPTGNP
jgi:hypothetical protein